MIPGLENPIPRRLDELAVFELREQSRSTPQQPARPGWSPQRRMACAGSGPLRPRAALAEGPHEPKEAPVPNPRKDGYRAVDAGPIQRDRRIDSNRCCRQEDEAQGHRADEQRISGQADRVRFHLILGSHPCGRIGAVTRGSHRRGSARRWRSTTADRRPAQLAPRQSPVPSHDRRVRYSYGAVTSPIVL